VFLLVHVGVQVDVGGGEVFVSEPERDDGDVDAGMGIAKVLQHLLKGYYDLKSQKSSLSDQEAQDMVKLAQAEAELSVIRRQALEDLRRNVESISIYQAPELPGQQISTVHSGKKFHLWLMERYLERQKRTGLGGAVGQNPTP
jgi:hypothetical protein